MAYRLREVLDEEDEWGAFDPYQYPPRDAVLRGAAAVLLSNLNMMA